MTCPLSAFGFNPVISLPKGNGFATLVGECRSYLEAEALKRDLNETGIAQGFVVPGLPNSAASNEMRLVGFQNDGVLTTSLLFQLPKELGVPVSTAELQQEEIRAESAAMEHSAVLRNARGLSKAKRHGDALQELERNQTDIPSESRWMARMELGRLRGVQRRPQQEVIDAYLPVARGAVISTRLHREKAVAAIGHALRYRGDAGGQPLNRPVDAYRAYREVLFYARDLNVRAEAALECVALTLESVKGRQAGAWTDVLAEADRARLFIPAGDRKHATVDLIVAEAEYYRGELEEAIAKSVLLMEQHKECHREVRMARIVAALASRMSGDTTRSLEWLRKNVEHQYKDRESENFASTLNGEAWDTRTMSMQWLLLFARQDQDVASERHWSHRIRAERPDVARRLGLEPPQANGPTPTAGGSQ